MKTLTISALAVASTFALTAHLHSQAPAVAKSPIQQLQDMKVKNKELLEKQAATLLKLDALQKEAEQVKFLAKRT